MSRRVNAHNLEAYHRARRWTFLLLALGFFLAVPAYLAIRNHWPKEVRERLAALVDEGVPINLAAAQTQFYPPIPDEENGAIACQKAFERIRKFELSWDSTTDPSAPLAKEHLQEIRRILEENQEALSFLHEARKFSKARFPVDLTHGYAALMKTISASGSQELEEDPR
jgi:hypothetical protein